MPRSAVFARNLHLDGPRGRVYGPIDLDVPAGTVTVVTGRAGSGRTALLLTLTGRLKPSPDSELVVLGHELPREARDLQLRSSAIGIHGLDDLDEEVSVGASVRERLAWLAPWYKIIHRATDETVREVCAPVFGDLPIPTKHTVVHELDELSNLLLRVSLAMLSDPEIIVLDEVDQLHDPVLRDLAWERLEVLAEQGVTVIASASSTQELERPQWRTEPQHLALPDHEGSEPPHGILARLHL